MRDKIIKEIEKVYPYSGESGHGRLADRIIYLLAKEGYGKIEPCIHYFEMGHHKECEECISDCYSFKKIK